MKGMNINFSSFEIKFEFNKKVIIPILEKCVYETSNYAIYGTNFSDYYVKIYETFDEKVNSKLANHFVKTAHALFSANHLNLKVHNVNTINIYKAVLIDSYFDDITELIKSKYFSTYFDFYKLIFQIGEQIQNLASEEIEGFQIKPECIVTNNHMNFKLTHLEENLNTEEGRNGRTRSINDIPLAPEFERTKRYTIESNMWDFGAILYFYVTGNIPELTMGSDKVQLDFEGIKVSQVLRSIIEEMMMFKAADRTKPDKLVQKIRDILSRVLEPQIIRIEDPSLKIHQPSLFGFEIGVNHRYFENFSGYTSTTKEAKNVQDMVSQMINPNCILADESMKKLILDGWKSQEKHIKFYMELKDKLPQILNHIVASMKVLITLHSYIFRGSRACLAVFLKDGMTNVVEMILHSILENYSRINEPFVVNYTVLLLRKFKFHFKHIKIIENNYSISKMWLVEIWKEMVGFEFLRDLSNHFSFTFAIFNYFKRFKFNYFSKNCIMFIAKEFMNLFALFVNVLSFIIYSKDKVGISGTEKNAIEGFLNYLIELLENHRFSFSNSILEMSKKDFKALEVFQVSLNVKDGFGQLKEIVKSDNREFNILDFISIYFNKLIRIPESSENREFKVNPKAEAVYRDVKSARLVLGQLAKGILETDMMSLAVFSVPGFIYTEGPSVPIGFNASKLGVEKSELVLPGRSTSKDQTFNLKEVKTFGPAKIYVEFGVQVDLNKEQEDLRKEEAILRSNPREEPQLRLATPIPVKEAQMVNKLSMREEYINMGKGDENFESQEGLEKFLLSVFARSVDEWIVNFNDLNFENLLASGSTCNVYRGFYRSLCVAIKKLTKPDNEAKIKFLKEFKREISLLVSLPNHPSLLTLIGFCIKSHEVYLISEYCEGGTLFDILYKKKSTFRLN